MRARTGRPFSSNTRARLEPRSLTREPRGSLWALVVGDMFSLDFASTGGRWGRLPKSGIRLWALGRTRSAASLQEVLSGRGVHATMLRVYRGDP